jgi:hypothetical protein
LLDLKNDFYNSRLKKGRREWHERRELKGLTAPFCWPNSRYDFSIAQLQRKKEKYGEFPKQFLKPRRIPARPKPRWHQTLYLLSDASTTGSLGQGRAVAFFSFYPWFQALCIFFFYLCFAQ